MKLRDLLPCVNDALNHMYACVQLVLYVVFSVLVMLVTYMWLLL